MQFIHNIGYIFKWFSSLFLFAIQTLLVQFVSLFAWWIVDYKNAFYFCLLHSWSIIWGMKNKFKSSSFKLVTLRCIPFMDRIASSISNTIRPVSVFRLPLLHTHLVGIFEENVISLLFLKVANFPCKMKSIIFQKFTGYRRFFFKLRISKNMKNF